VLSAHPARSASSVPARKHEDDYPPHVRNSGRAPRDPLERRLAWPMTHPAAPPASAATHSDQSATGSANTMGTMPRPRRIAAAIPERGTVTSPAWTDRELQ